MSPSRASPRARRRTARTQGAAAFTVRVHEVHDQQSLSRHTKVMVFDGWNKIAAEGRGEVATTLKPGVYTIRLMRGGENFQEHVVHTGVTTLDYQEPVRASAALMADARTSHEYYTGPAIEWSNRDTKAAASLFNAPPDAPRLFVFARAEDKQRALPDNLVDGLSLQRLDGTCVTRFDETVTERDKQLGWVAFSARVTPDCYLLSYKTRVTPIHCFQKWDSQVFIPFEDQLNLSGLSFFFSEKGTKFDPSDRATIAMDAALSGLRSGLRLLPRDLRDQVLEAKFNNPMLGLIGAYSLLSEPKPSARTVNLVLRNLERLLPQSPDVSALKILAASRSNRPPPAADVSMPPMLRAGLDGLLLSRDANPKADSINLLLDEIAIGAVDDTVWTQWTAPPRAAAGERTKALLRRSAVADQPATGEAFALPSGLGFEAPSIPRWITNMVEDEKKRALRTGGAIAADQLAKEAGLPTHIVQTAIDRGMRPAPAQADSPINEQRFKNVVDASRDERDRVRMLVYQNRWDEAEKDRDRFVRYEARRARELPAGAEAKQGDTLDLQAAWFLPEGAQVRRAVAYVEVNGTIKSEAGTGFLVSPTLFMTNQHVIESIEDARRAIVVFDRELDDVGRPRPTTTYFLDPDRFALFSRQEELDYALIAIGARSSGEVNLEEFSYIILSDQPDKHAIGMNVNIIQHPQGWPKMISVRNNLLTHRTPRTLLYETDTEHGSSGAPVFNDDWELVALHHWGEPYLEKIDESGRTLPINVNEGVRISEIYRNLETRYTELSSEKQALLRTALGFSKQVREEIGRKRLQPPRPGTSSENILIRENAMTSNTSSTEARIVVPLEVIVRIGGVDSGRPALSAAGDSRPAASLAPPARGAEKVVLDRDYSNRDGYDPDFISGLSLPLPKPSARLANRVAPLLPDQPDADTGELKYQHFSIKMHKLRRMAIFTATNIDGDSYLNVDRDTGRVSDDSAEGETWYKDPRIDEGVTLLQPFYAEWSHYFDRGHLTRRMDPNWGSPEQAERANGDTYHFTNCTPQHFRFNQTTRFWQGAERYILENGAIAEGTRNRICVFQGPIFNAAIDWTSDGVQIPSSFFKVIVWKGRDGVKSVGLVVDQNDLMSETRTNLGKPRPLAPVNVNQWRVSIADIEKRTDLDFGATVRNADTIGATRQPAVGEALLRIASFDDLL